MVANFITWTADPNLFDGFVTVRWYGLMFAIGFLIGYEIVSKIFKHEGAPESWLGSLFAYVVIATIVGARLGHVFFYEWDFYSQHPAEILKIWEGGLASHGGTIGIIIAIFLYSYFVTKKSPLWTFDRLVIPVALVGALIRFGNLMNHEIYGHPTDATWGFSFIDNINQWMAGAPPIFTPPSHPTQLYEAACYFILFIVLMWMYWRKNAEERPGLIFGVFLIGIFGSRFIIEYFKNVQVDKEIEMINTYGMNLGQMLSIPFVLIGIGLIVYAMKNPRLHLKFPNKFADEKKK